MTLSEFNSYSDLELIGYFIESAHKYMANNDEDDMKAIIKIFKFGALMASKLPA